ncbi:MAG: type II toxin-antitoxin system HicB family antitoxin [Rhodospirillaceae bacterium]|nr:type II toxin-antitoxin system HicB family antitoxin [Rhodospirillaceae bacterium]
MRHYIAVLIPEQEGWSVLFPDLPGCATQGDTLDEAMDMAVDALAGHIAVMREFGDKVPAARSLDEVKADKAWCEENEVVWGKAMAAPIMVRPPLGKPERVTISMDSNVLRALDTFARKRGQTRSSVLTAAAEILLGHPVEDMRDESLEVIAGDLIEGGSRGAPKKAVRGKAFSSKAASEAGRGTDPGEIKLRRHRKTGDRSLDLQARTKKA